MWALQAYAQILIHSCRIAPVEFLTEIPRPPEKVAAEVGYIRSMLDDAGLTMVEIHTKPWKPVAVAYVDDKGVHYSGRPNAWKNLVPKLAAMCGVEHEVAI